MKSLSILVDLSEYSEEEILAMHVNAMVVNMVMALKFGRDNEYLFEHFDLVMYRSLEYVDIHLGKNFLEVTFVYLASINRIPNEKWEKMIDKLPKPVKSKAMTMYERLLKEGEEIGIRKGEKLTIQVIRLHKSNTPPEKIAKDLGVSLDFVERIIREFDDLLS